MNKCIIVWVVDVVSIEFDVAKILNRNISIIQRSLNENVIPLLSDC